MEAKKILSRKTGELLELARDIQGDKDDLPNFSGWWNKRKAKGSLGSKSNKLRKQYDRLKKEYELYKFENDIT